MSDQPDDAESRRLAANIQTIKQSVRGRAAEIKRDLAQWLDQTVPPADSVSASTDLAVQRRRGTLQ
jgi:hypothetical protein